jgi:hypothetical protein
LLKVYLHPHPPRDLLGKSRGDLSQRATADTSAVAGEVGNMRDDNFASCARQEIISAPSPTIFRGRGQGEGA